jgi:hypothetical protein
MRKEPTCSFEKLEMQAALMYCHQSKTPSLFTIIVKAFKAFIIVKSVQNAALLWVLMIVCVDFIIAQGTVKHRFYIR